MNNPQPRRRTNPNRLQPKKRGKTSVILGAAAASLAVGIVGGIAWSEMNKADEIHAQESAKKTPPKPLATTPSLTTTTTTTAETTQPMTTSITPEVTNPQGKEVIDPRDEKLRERAGLFSGCKVMGLYDEGGNNLKLEISTTVNADNYHIRQAAKSRGESIYGSGVAIYQTDKNGAILNQSPIVRTPLAQGGKDQDGEHPFITLPKQEGAHYEVSITTGAAIGDKALVSAVACDVIAVENGRWSIADVPAISGSRFIS